MRQSVIFVFTILGILFFGMDLQAAADKSTIQPSPQKILEKKSVSAKASVKTAAKSKSKATAKIKSSKKKNLQAKVNHKKKPKSVAQKSTTKAKSKDRKISSVKPVKKVTAHKKKPAVKATAKARGQDTPSFTLKKRAKAPQKVAKNNKYWSVQCRQGFIKDSYVYCALTTASVKTKKRAPAQVAAKSTKSLQR